MSSVGVFIGGEGANELGGHARELNYQGPAPDSGVVEALLRSVAQEGWHVVGATRWASIRKYNAKGPTPSEERNVQA